MIRRFYPPGTPQFFIHHLPDELGVIEIGRFSRKQMKCYCIEIAAFSASILHIAAFIQ